MDSLYATPIVPVLKKDGSVRICGDYSVTLNPNLLVHECPMPTVDELFADLAGCKYFAKIDCSQAYLQMPVDEETAELLTINTPRGLFRVLRLMFGVAPAPAIWQENMLSLFRLLKGVRVFQDDIRMKARTIAELIKIIETVLQILDKYNIKVNLDKCSFFEKNIKYCGFVIDARGIHKDPTKFEAIENMPPPKNLSELRSFIGMNHFTDIK